MMGSNHTNVAYIDAANLQSAAKEYEWQFDYARFRVWLREKFHVCNAYLFVGYMDRYRDRYLELEKIGYLLIFRTVVYAKDGKPKGNCDADLVLHATRDVFEKEYDQAILVSSDGDYDSLISFLKEKDKCRGYYLPHITTNAQYYSNAPVCLYGMYQTSKHCYKFKMKRPPTETRLCKGSFRGYIRIIQ
jgi:hypothetical protein